jgi:glycosyltransferase involved in cell wall biosynthesis
MTVYNGLPFLQHAIESVLNQTFVEFEFLIIDDASTDDSVSYIRSCGDSRIRLVCNEHNLGQARSLNMGLNLAKGVYIARLDQDDVCLPERLEKQITFLEENGKVGVICSWMYSIDSHGHKMRNWRRELENYGAFLGYLVVGKVPIWHPSVVFRRQIVADLGGYDESYAPAEDFDLWIRIAMRRYSAAIVPQFLVMQRVHKGQQSVQKAVVQVENWRRAHDRLIKDFCNRPEVEIVGLLLRMERMLWDKCRSKRQVERVLDALNEMLANLQTALGLSPAEFASLRRVIYRRLGLGARFGRKISFVPSVLFFPIFFVLSPLLVPGVQQALSWMYAKAHELRYPGRLIQSHFKS